VGLSAGSKAEFFHLGGLDNEGETVGEGNLREMQDNPAQRKGDGDLRQSEAQTKTRLGGSKVGTDCRG
jgi:hypothetical protein